MSYYQHTQPSLQEFYSHYATQWEHFYEGHELTDSAFLRFLENSAYPLQMKYNRGDLNLQYYIDRFHTLKNDQKSGNTFVIFFLINGITCWQIMNIITK